MPPTTHPQLKLVEGDARPPGGCAINPVKVEAKKKTKDKQKTQTKKAAQSKKAMREDDW